MNFSSICLLIGLIVSANTLPPYIAGTCNTPDNKSGVIVELNQCLSLYVKFASLNMNDTDTVNFLQASQSPYGYYNNGPLVCCSDQLDDLFPVKCHENTNNIVPLKSDEEGECPDLGYHILYGDPAKIGEFPWAALIIKYQCRNKECPPKYLCGGSLITQRYVLTAAHCYLRMANEVTVVRLAENDYSVQNDQRVDFLIEKYILHPDYEPISKLNDIALIRLSTEVTFNDNIKPICLASTNLNQLEAGHNLTAIGWGKTENDPYSTKLLKTVLPLGHHTTCTNLFARAQLTFTDTQICAGGGKQDTCEGDSGGPLMLKIRRDGKCEYLLVGVTSLGIQCGAIGVPAVYTRVSSFYDWIVKNTEI